MKGFFILIALALIVAVSPAAFAKGRLGFEAKITASGFFHPTLKHVSVLAIAPHSPAVAAGLKVGDEILKINGEQIAGAPAKQMSAVISDAKPGQHLSLVVKRGNAVLAIDLVVGSGK